MDPNNVTFLNDITWRLSEYTIKVKVLRLWKRANRKIPGETLAIDMVVMDEQVSFAIIISYIVYMLHQFFVYYF
jgi:hypothetical protein